MASSRWAGTAPFPRPGQHRDTLPVASFIPLERLEQHFGATRNSGEPPSPVALLSSRRARDAAAASVSRVAETIEALPDGARDALLLFAWEDLWYRSVAEALELPIGNRSRRDHRR